MKQKIYILGVITAMVIFLGTIFKVNHWPAAAIMMTVGMGTLVLGFLPLALINHYKSESSRQNLLLHIITWLTCFVVFTGMLFKILHWPFAATILTVALIFPYVVFLPVFLVTISKDKNFNIYNTVFVFLLLAVNSVFSALLSLNVSRERIWDSYNLSRQYNQVEKILYQFPANNSKSQVAIKIDEALKVVDEYKNLILRSEGISPEHYNDAGSLLRPDLKGTAIQTLSTSGNVKVGEKLENGLKALVKEIDNTPGCEELAKAIPVILDLRKKYDDEPLLIWHNITNTMSWTFIYLEGLKVNLLMIRASMAI